MSLLLGVRNLGPARRATGEKGEEKELFSVMDGREEDRGKDVLRWAREAVRALLG